MIRTMQFQSWEACIGVLLKSEMARWKMEARQKRVVHLAFISTSSRLHLAFISTSSRLHLAFISPSSRLHLDFISTSSRLHLDFISPSSRLHLDFISTSSRLHLASISTSSRLHLAFISSKISLPIFAQRLPKFRPNMAFQYTQTIGLGRLKQALIWLRFAFINKFSYMHVCWIEGGILSLKFYFETQILSGRLPCYE